MLRIAFERIAGDVHLCFSASMVLEQGGQCWMELLRPGCLFND